MKKKKIPKKDQDPRKDPSTQMCARNRQKSFLPEKNLPTEISRSLSRTPGGQGQHHKLFRRRLSDDTASRDPHVDRAIITSTKRQRVRGWGQDHGFPPEDRIIHPGGSVSSLLRSSYVTRICSAADSRRAEMRRENQQLGLEFEKSVRLCQGSHQDPGAREEE